MILKFLTKCTSWPTRHRSYVCANDVCRNCKPRNRPSFRQILLHLDIASADVLSTPQETYFKSQVTHLCRQKCGCYKWARMYCVRRAVSYLRLCVRADVYALVCLGSCVWWVQAEWREEVKQHFEKIKSEGTCLHRLDEELINRRREELRSVPWQQQT